MVGSFWEAENVAMLAQRAAFSLTTILAEVERKAGMKTLKGEVRCGRNQKTNPKNDLFYSISLEKYA